MAGTAALTLVLAACGSEDDGDKPKAEDSNSSSPAEGTSSSAAPADLTDDACAGGATSADTFKVGGILPITGTLAFLGPPEISGVGLAVSDINAAGGVDGAKACYQMEDSGDTTDLSISTNSADKLIQGKPSVVIGAASSSVTENVVQTFKDAKVTEISPANTALSLSGVSPFYFRTVTPDAVQGNALGTLIGQDGYSKVAFIVFNDTYGTGLRDQIESTVTDNGGSCVYGCKGDGDEFPAAQTTFTTEVQGAIGANPDAIVVLAFDETKAIVPELVTQGWDMSKTYYSDGNTADYSEDLAPGSLKGAQGTIPGADASKEFKSQVNAWAELSSGKPLSDYSYSAESYDAVILSALAALKGGATDSVTVQKNLPAVSGTTNGTECKTYAECAELIGKDEEIKYTGPSGIGPFNDKNDPSSGFVGIYQFDDKNAIKLTSTIEGQSS
jgi:neutral amino acid transport system substrate-binding protein